MPGLYKAHAVALRHPDEQENVLGGVSEGTDGDADLEKFTFIVVQSFYEDDGWRAMTDKQIGAEFARQCAGGKFR